ncbi:MAG: hypothetical protein R2853_18710 [Thermomicrobiales bacterium]|nr:hypothetical protein [Thermomicrobiales bacterium]
MHDHAFDQAVRDHAPGIPRRGLLGLSAGLSALVLGHSATEARRKKRRKRKKCKNGKTKCGKKCFNLGTDSANCGACGVVCSGGTSCSGGTCTCPAGESFIAGACIPRFGCTLDLDTCEVGKKSCPDQPGDADARCHVSADGEPFCATAEECTTVSDSSACPTIGGKNRILIPCGSCDDPGETGECVLPLTQVGNAQ